MQESIEKFFTELATPTLPQILYWGISVIVAIYLVLTNMMCMLYCSDYIELKDLYLYRKKFNSQLIIHIFIYGTILSLLFVIGACFVSYILNECFAMATIFIYSMLLPVCSLIYTFCRKK